MEKLIWNQNTTGTTPGQPKRVQRVVAVSPSDVELHNYIEDIAQFQSNLFSHLVI